MLRPTVRCCLQLEALDSRDVPAVVHWISTGSTDYYNPSNWDSGQVPTGNDDVYFDGAYSNVSAGEIDPGVAGIGSLHLVDGYTGTVTVGTPRSSMDLWLNTLELTSGSIAQPYAEQSAITVLGSFIWTGGTLNSSASLANLNISGSTTTATINPNGGTVNLGDNISLLNGAVATINAGTISMTNDGEEIDIETGSGLNADPGTGKDADIDKKNVEENGALMRITDGGYFRVLSGDWKEAGYMVNADGEFTLKSGTTAYLTGIQNGTTAYIQDGGSTLLYGGSAFSTDASKEIKIQGSATLATVADANADCSATIDTGTLRMTGGDIYINFGAPAHTTFGTLSIMGDVIWSGGTFHPFVQNDTTNADQLSITGTLTFLVGATASIAPTAIDAEWIPCMPTSGEKWLMITTTGGITTNNNPPRFTSTGIWALDPILDMNNNLTGWNLKAQ
jgi:hypothetical protein